MGLKCAGKKIHEVLLEQGETNYIVRHFEEECRILSSLRHPNIVQFLGVHFNENKRVPMLVMEFLPMNLTSCIQKHGIPYTLRFLTSVQGKKLIIQLLRQQKM